jgi:hypothetical protein
MRLGVVRATGLPRSGTVFGSDKHAFSESVLISGRPGFSGICCGTLCGRFERGGRGHDAVPAGPFCGIQCRISRGECLHEGGFRLMTS